MRLGEAGWRASWEVSEKDKTGPPGNTEVCDLLPIFIFLSILFDISSSKSLAQAPPAYKIKQVPQGHFGVEGGS